MSEDRPHQAAWYPDGNDQQKAEILARMEGRVRDLEQWRGTFEAVNAERRETQAEQFSRLDARLGTIERHIGRLVWLVIAAIFSAFMTWILQGGLTIGS